MAGVNAPGYDPTPAPSASRPVSVKNRPAQAAKLATQAQQEVRQRKPRPPERPKPAIPSDLGRRIDVRA